MKLLKGLLLSLLIFNNALQISAQGYPHVSLAFKNIPLSEAISKIEKATSYTFFYDSKVDLTQKVSLSVKDTPLDRALNEMLQNTGYQFEINNTQIALVKKQQNTNESSPNSIKVTGIVLNKKGEPAIGASVSVKGTTIGTNTDVDGKFTLNVPANSLMVFSYIGYNRQELPIKKSTTLKVILEEESKTLDEVVVVGYGTQKKANLTGAVASIAGNELAKRPVYNTTSTLQGKLPGLTISQSTGQPGNEGITMRIRGLGTFSGAGSDPLVIIDGISGNLNSVNPADIENVSILKDAASASIYGARAANGVIVITTKSGRSGKLSLTYDVNYAVHTPTRMLKLITNSAEYMELANEAITNSGLPPTNKYPQDIIDLYRNATDRTKYPNYDWIDLMFNPALAYSHNLNVNGGGEKTTYNSSIGYSKQDGVMMGFNNQRFNFSINTKTVVNEFITFGTKANLYYNSIAQPSNGATDMFLATLSQPPTYGPTLYDGTNRYTYRAYGNDVSNKNPYAMARESRQSTGGMEVNANAWIELKFSKHFSLYTKGAATGNYKKQKTFLPKIPLYYYHSGIFERNLDVGGTEFSSTVKDEDALLVTLYSHLTYDNKFGDHSVKVLAGFNQESYKYNYLEGYRQGYVNNILKELDAGATDGQTSKGSANEWGIQSLFGRVNYDYAGKYLLEVNIRYDGTSRLYKTLRWGAFPSASIGWRISEEEFLKKHSWINNLKLRLSYGVLGNQNIGNYPYQQLLNLGNNYTFNNSDISSGIAPGRLSNRQIRWERTKSWDIGLDGSFLDNKLSFTLDLYKKTTSDILRTSQVTSSIGLEAPTVNSGTVTNTGVELTVSHQNRLSNGLSYSISGMFIKNINRLAKFGAEEKGGTTIKREGLPWDSYYLYKWTGIFQSNEEIAKAPVHPYNPKPGDLRYEDVSGPDGKPDNKIDSYDRVVAGGRFPDFEYSFNLNAEYKNFFISAFFYGVKGIKFYVNGWGFEPFLHGSPPTENWRNRWTPQNPTNTMPGIYVGGQTPAMSNMPSTYFLQDASYLRLKTLQLGYNFQNSWVKAMKINSIRLYFSADNLLAFTKFPYLDPERPASVTTMSVYPQNRVLSVGANINF